MVENVTVQVPAQAGHVGVIRTVVAGVGAHEGLSVDAIEDLRLAVDEACGQLLRMSPGATQLTVQVASADGAIEVVAAVDGQAPEAGRSSAEEFLTWHILGALTDGAALEQTSAGTAIRFTKSTHPMV